jgi:hypothetical protein
VLTATGDVLFGAQGTLVVSLGHSPIAFSENCAITASGEMRRWSNNVQIPAPSGSFTQIPLTGCPDPLPAGEILYSTRLSCELDATDLACERYPQGAFGTTGSFVPGSFVANANEAWILGASGSVTKLRSNNTFMTVGSGYSDLDATSGFVAGIKSDSLRCDTAIESVPFYPGNAAAPTGYVEVALSDGTVCARRTNDLVACNKCLDFAVAVTGPSGSFARIEGGDAGFCAQRADRSLQCWPAAGTEQAPYFRFDEIFSAPSGPFKDFSVGRSSACGLRDDGHLECWGGGAHLRSL